MIDGATDLYQDSALPAERDVIWLVDVVADRLAEQGAAGYQGPAVALLNELADSVAAHQNARQFPSGRLPPACSIAVVVDHGATYEAARLGDATVVVTGERPARLATGYFDDRETAAVTAKRAGQSAEEVRAAMRRRREHYMTAGDVETVFSGHPRRRLRPYTMVGSWDGIRHMMLCTDGFARLVTDYALYQNWDAAVEAAGNHGLAYLEHLLRDHERNAREERRPRFKRADDAAAVLITPGPAATHEGDPGRD